MPLYEFSCPCGHSMEVIWKVSEYQEPSCPRCGRRMEQVLKGHGGWNCRLNGKMTGMYDYDLGKKATWDLTPPGKYQDLKEKGIIRDPFDEN